MITLQNARHQLATTDLIDIAPLYYGGKVKPWWQFFKVRRRMFKVKKALDIRLSNGRVIYIHEGFETDLRSAPRWLWSVVSPFNDALLAYIIHDYLYIYCIESQAFADAEMLRWAETINDNHFDNKVCYRVVRRFGTRWWHESERKIREGLRKVPEYLQPVPVYETALLL